VLWWALLGGERGDDKARNLPSLQVLGLANHSPFAPSATSALWLLRNFRPQNTFRLFFTTRVSHHPSSLMNGGRVSW
jgi:hypothetical protein